MTSVACDIGIDNGIVIIGASKCSRERIVNTIGVIKRHLNNIKNLPPVNSASASAVPFTKEDAENEHHVCATWRTSPIKHPASYATNASVEHAPHSPQPPHRTRTFHLLQSTSSEHSPYKRRDREQIAPISSSSSQGQRGHREEDQNEDSDLDPFLTPPPSPRGSTTTTTPPTTPSHYPSSFSTFSPPPTYRYLHSQQQHSSILNNPLFTHHTDSSPAPSFSSMDVDILGLSVLVEDLSSIMNRMTLFVDPACGNLLRFSSDQPLLGSSLLSLASPAELPAAPAPAAPAVTRVADGGKTGV